MQTTRSTAEIHDRPRPLITRATVLILSGWLLGVSAGRLLPPGFEVYTCCAGLTGLHAYLALEYQCLRDDRPAGRRHAVGAA